MNLVGYSDSEGSDNEAPSASKAAARPPIKAAPQLVDPTTHTVKVNLSGLTSRAGADTETERDTRPAKRQRTGGGLNINAFLPPPKQPSKPLNNESGPAGKKAPGRGLGKGVNLKTGAEPAFTRSEASSSLDLDGEPKDIKEVIAELRRSRPSTNPVARNGDSPTQESTPPASKEIKLVGNPIRFKPKSVALNASKKKKLPLVHPASNVALAQKATGIAKPDPRSSTASAPGLAPTLPTKAKVSLFSMAQEEISVPTQPAAGEYESAFMDDTEMAEVPDEAFETHVQASTIQGPEAAASTSTRAVADLNLSAADMRQLFGRKAGKHGNMPDLTSVKMVNFNADAEYAANEELRANGEIVQHNPVRAIAPGKHTLKQLVNAAATQKDALEEHFALGKRNQREAGSRYGW